MMPKNETRDTKKVILTVALKLFSERGYDGVGIRDIAKEIGIRESALYKHYSGKQDIFDSILKDVELRYQEVTSNFIPPEKIASTLSEEHDTREELFYISLTMFNFYLKTEYGSQLRRMLTIEQYNNSEAGEFFRKLIINNGLNYISNIFVNLIKEGIYIDTDPMVMALQFYSPIYLLLCKYDSQTDKYEEALSFLGKHISQFNKIYLRRDKQ
jgi:AcrR family transcriptional regulator